MLKTRETNVGWCRDGILVSLTKGLGLNGQRKQVVWGGEFEPKIAESLNCQWATLSVKNRLEKFWHRRKQFFHRRKIPSQIIFDYRYALMHIYTFLIGIKVILRWHYLWSVWGENVKSHKQYKPVYIEF